MSWYLSLRIRTSDASQLEKEKIRKDRRKKRGTCIIFRFKITLCQADAGAHRSYLLWEIYTEYMAVSMPEHGDLTALFMSHVSLS